jgi:hypothetical protein
MHRGLKQAARRLSSVWNAYGSLGIGPLDLLIVNGLIEVCPMLQLSADQMPPYWIHLRMCLDEENGAARAQSAGRWQTGR